MDATRQSTNKRKLDESSPQVDSDDSSHELSHGEFKESGVSLSRPQEVTLHHDGGVFTAALRRGENAYILARLTHDEGAQMCRAKQQPQ